jgi:hypothetical protein
MKSSFFQSAIIALTFVAVPCLIFTQAGATSDPAEMSADQVACQDHAKAISGYDPANPQASVQESGPPPQRGAGLRGAARGAAKGAVVGGTVEHFGDDDRNDATEIGAATAAVAGGVRSRRQARKEAETQQTQAISSGSSAYTQSYNECMTSRGY